MRSRIKIQTSESTSKIRKQSTSFKDQETMRKSDIESIGIMPEFEKDPLTPQKPNINDE